jgi:copper chaperone
MLNLKIGGMTCKHCAMHVQKALTGVPGVTSAEVSLESGEARVEGSVDLAALVAAVEEEGYSAGPQG